MKALSIIASAIWLCCYSILAKANSALPPPGYYTLRLALPIPIACGNSPLRYNGTTSVGFTAGPYSPDDDEVVIAIGPRNGTLQVIPTDANPGPLPRVLSLIDHGAPDGAELRSSTVDVIGDNWVQQQQNGTVMTWRAWSTIAINGRQFLRHGYPPKSLSPWDLRKDETTTPTRWIVTYSQRQRGGSNGGGSYDIELAPLSTF